jgi:SNW domain-containing protein 1
LPKPKNGLQPKKTEASEAQPKPREFMAVPPYGSRAGFQLSGDDEADFPEDSGAYPEIHTPQYPYGLGRKGRAGDETGGSLVARSTVTRQYDSAGSLQYGLLARMGHDEGRLVQASLSDMLPAAGEGGVMTWAKPPAEEIARQAEATRAALERVLNGRIRATQPKHAKAVETTGAHFVRFTPADAQADGEAAAQRVVRMAEAQRDPLEPAKFSHRRIPKPPPSPPAPVLHSPPRRVPAEEQAAWRVPPCISNWKNAKGYTIPLDKRLAADGRGLLEHGINERFAGFAESLYLAEQHARAEVEKRAAVEQRIAGARKAQAEESLRLLAQQARAEKALLAQRLHEELEAEHGHELPIAGSGLTLQEREAIRREREKGAQRDLRLSRMGAEQRARYLARDADRDVSERIALGVATGATLPAADSMYDQRLFDQTAGVSAGFGDEDDYSLYSRPLFAYGASAGSHLIYKPGIGTYDGNDGEEEGVEEGGAEDGRAKAFQGASGTRTGPVEFERAPSTTEDDPFGLDQMLHEAKLGAKRSAPQ